MARASPSTVQAKFGAEQPSMPQPADGLARHLLKGLRTAC
jgi:hypothetical protein